MLRLDGWNTSGAKEHFPIKRFIVHLDTEFPASQNMVVSKDRKSWYCPICNKSQDVSKSSFHKQNAMKHFRSNAHCKNLAAVNKKGDQVAAAVQHNKETRVYGEDLPQAIMDDVIITSARKSISFTTIPMILSCVARALVACRGESMIPQTDIMKVRSVCPKAASVLVRLNLATKPESIRGGHTRPACVRSRRYVADRLVKIGKMTLKKKAEFLKTCPYLSLSADESDTYSFSAPLASALQGCSESFKWANLFMGQVDVAADKTGGGCFQSCRAMLDSIDSELFPRIVFLCTDGASAMRSTPKYAGLDSHVEGTSFHAHMKRADKPRLPDLHCCAHNLNLALKKALTLGGEWAKQWLTHVKVTYRWFSKSPSRKSKLKSLHAQMALVNDVVTWKMVYPKYYCPTRWLGISRALKSILASAPLLLQYTDGLMRQGFRPDRRNDNVEPAEAAHTRVDEDDDDDGARVHEDEFHEWGDAPWDLQVPRPEGDVDILSEDERLDLEQHGPARVWRDLPDATRKGKMCALMSERVGLTASMLGIDAMMVDVLEPYRILVERLQTQVCPISHKVRLWICLCFRDLVSMFLSDSPTYGPKFQDWVQRDDVNDAMTDQVRAMGRSFVFDFLSDARRRLQPYWKLILACETINPCAPARLSPNAWEGVRDLVDRCMGDDVDPRAVVEDLKSQHREAGNWCMAEVTHCTANLLRYYHDRLSLSVTNQQQPKHALADLFARLIFSLHVTSSVIETYFSKTRYIKNQYRARLRDSLAAMTLHLQQLRQLDGHDVLQNSIDYDLDLQAALNHVENDLNDLRSKYFGSRVTKPFVDEDTGEIRGYGGTVDDISWSATHGCYLFHVTYDSDSDDEDMEHWEVKKYSE